MAKLISVDLITTRLIPPITKLVTDECVHTRAALASVILGLSPILRRDDVFKSLLPLFLQLLKDSYPEVRLNIIAKLDSINNVSDYLHMNPPRLVTSLVSACFASPHENMLCPTVFAFSRGLSVVVYTLHCFCRGICSSFHLLHVF